MIIFLLKYEWVNTVPEKRESKTILKSLCRRNDPQNFLCRNVTADYCLIYLMSSN